MPRHAYNDLIAAIEEEKEEIKQKIQQLVEEIKKAKTLNYVVQYFATNWNEKDPYNAIGIIFHPMVPEHKLEKVAKHLQEKYSFTVDRVISTAPVLKIQLPIDYDIVEYIMTLPSSKISNSLPLDVALEVESIEVWPPLHGPKEYLVNSDGTVIPLNPEIQKIMDSLIDSMNDFQYTREELELIRTN